ncbi:hypothetical protein EV368DRAFT_79647 [Lentinula lateritia]|nr:hypothetical protein EV368DRAFT_79647 [Lentinula lateritia]
MIPSRKPENEIQKALRAEKQRQRNKAKRKEESGKGTAGTKRITGNSNSEANTSLSSQRSRARKSNAVSAIQNAVTLSLPTASNDLPPLERSCIQEPNSNCIRETAPQSPFSILARPYLPPWRDPNILNFALSEADDSRYRSLPTTSLDFPQMEEENTPNSMEPCSFFHPDSDHTLGHTFHHSPFTSVQRYYSDTSHEAPLVPKFSSGEQQFSVDSFSPHNDTTHESLPNPMATDPRILNWIDNVSTECKVTGETERDSSHTCMHISINHAQLSHSQAVRNDIGSTSYPITSDDEIMDSLSSLTSLDELEENPGEAQHTSPFFTTPSELPELDLVTGVRGVEVHQSAKTQIWPNGLETILPTLIKEKENVFVNVLEYDEERVAWMADPKNQTPPSNSIVRYLDRKLYKDKGLIEDIRKLTAWGYVVVVSGAIPDHGKDLLTLEEISYELGTGVSEGQVVSYHDLEKRACNPSNPHMECTLPEFLDNINEVNKVGVVLDLPTNQQALPAPYNVLNDGRCSWTQTLSQYRPMNPVFSDNFLSDAWILLHHAGILTNPHQDVDGEAVIWQVAGDRNNPTPKIWGIMTFVDPKAPCLPLRKLHRMITDICELRTKAKAPKPKRGEIWPLEDPYLQWEKCSLELIYAIPGDIIIQPPGTIHVVYTPAACITIGSQSFSYDTLHLTEFTRDLHRKHANHVTNQAQQSINETLHRMVLALPNHPNRGE